MTAIKAQKLTKYSLKAVWENKDENCSRNFQYTINCNVTIDNMMQMVQLPCKILYN